MYFRPCCEERVVLRDVELHEGGYFCVLCGIVLGKRFLGPIGAGGLLLSKKIGMTLGIMQIKF